MSLLARQLVQSEPVTIAADRPLLEVVHLFVVAQIRGAPVVDERGAVRGMVSASDVLRAIDQIFDEDVDAGEERDAAGGLARLVARDVATPAPIWVAPETPISEVARLMRREGVHEVLVGTGGRLEGILTAFDALAAIAA